MERGFLSNIELRTPGGRIYYVAATIALLLIAVVTLFPFFFAFTSGLKNSTEIFAGGLNLFPQTPLWQNYEQAWRQFDMVRMFKNSLVIVSVGVVLRLVVSGAAAYSLSILKPIGGRFLTVGFLLTLMVPSIAYFVPLYTTIADMPIIHVSLLNSYWALWLVYCVDAFSIFVFKTFFDTIPRDLIDSARVDGANPLQLLVNIIFPLSRSITVVLAVLAFVALWKDFLLPYLVITDPQAQPITVRLFYLADDYSVNLQMAASFISLLPPLLIAIVLQRYMKIGVTLGAVKG
ncbi:carbohydrate ABC transporter permease [Phototrophicus methaneseepsis]|uniref:Carbohydrate ABC transporter permease n=1 Tax=Phototrophicus methaneseepsis TaxID=2710758 RepID=A0A7S8IFB4_9CHLR|nr:carbohydrate ABC transporter permease [Phototrophicus methaneseepsis]QPC83324.1 carbohydrate ABC transporter permease [Phototrophicus methaneseepsis]